MVNDYTLPETSGLNNASPNAPMYANGGASQPQPIAHSSSSGDGNLNIGATTTEKFNKVLTIIATIGLVYFGYRIFKAYNDEKNKKEDGKQ